MVRTASPVREAHLYPPRLPFPKHRPIVENGTFSTGPFVRNRREPRERNPSARFAGTSPFRGGLNGADSVPRARSAPLPATPSLPQAQAHR